MNYGIYHGCHNSFVIGRDKLNCDYENEARQLCKLHGTDGYIILKVDPLEMVYYNSDGTRAPMCGNGVRCFVKYGYDIGVINSKKINVNTMGGNLDLEIMNLDPFTVKVDLGKPIFASSKLGINSNNEVFINETISIRDNNIIASAVFMNTHHLVIYVDDFDGFINIADEIHRHPIFTEKINVNYVIVRNNHKLDIRTYERGVGWTLACGTGAASAYVISKIFGYVDEYADVESIGGVLRISNHKDNIIMEGPVITLKEPNYESTT